MYRQHHLYCPSMLLMIAAVLRALTTVTAGASCSLTILGHTDRIGLKEASLACTGGSISIAVHPVLQPFKDRFTVGVTWSAEDDCLRRQAHCLLTICGNSDATFNNAVVAGVAAPSNQRWNMLCAAGDSKLQFNGANVSSNRGCGMLVNERAQVTVSNSTFDSNVPFIDIAGTAIAVFSNAKLSVRSSHFAGNMVAGNGGAIAMYHNTTVDIATSIFHNNSVSGADGGALYAYHTAPRLVRVTACNFTNNTAVRGDGGAISAHQSTSVVMTNCRMSGNKAQKGGAVAMHHTAHVDARSCTLEHNQAQELGGAVFAKDEAFAGLEGARVHGNACEQNGGAIALINNATLRLRQSIVSGNQAAKFGGGMRLQSSRFLTSEVLTALERGQNSAPYGADYSVVATQLSLQGPAVVPDFVSRVGNDEGWLPVKLKATGLQGLPSQVDVRAAVEGTPLGINKARPDGVVHMALKLRRPPGTYRLEFTVIEEYSIAPAFLSVIIVNCSVGDVTIISEGMQACQACLEGTFSLNPRNTMCDPCPPNALCPGGPVMLALPGYWQSAPQSFQMHKCQNPAACIGIRNTTLLQAIKVPESIKSYQSLQCAEGYIGHLCAECAGGFGMTHAFSCSKCLSASIIISVFVVAAVGMLALVKLLCHLTLRDSASSGMKPHPTDLLKPLVLYAQWLLLISAVDAPWPQSCAIAHKGLAAVWASASSTYSVVSLDCVLPRNVSMPIAAQQVALGVTTPLATLALLVLLEVVLVSVRPGKAMLGGSLADRCISTALVVLFIFLPSICRTAFGLFACLGLDKEVQEPFTAAAVGTFWKSDMSQTCYSGYHRVLAMCIGVPLAAFLCVILPGGIVVFMLQNRARLHDRRFRHHYGFIYRSYKSSCCWWEAVHVTLTNALVALYTLGYSLNAFNQTLAMLAVLMLNVVLLSTFRPYKHACAGRVATLAGACLVFTAYSALVFMPYGGVPQNATFSVVWGAVVLAANAAFVAFTLWQLWKLVDWPQLRQGIARVGQVIDARIGCCKQPLALVTSSASYPSDAAAGEPLPVATSVASPTLSCAPQECTVVADSAGGTP